MTIQKLLSRQLRKPAGITGIFAAHLMNWGNRDMYRLLLEKSSLLPGNRILEAGFGSGRHIPYIMGLADNLSYAGIDLSPTMVEMATRYNRKLVNEKRVELSAGDILNIPYPPSAFEVILTVNTIYFWNDPLKAINELARVLKPGGTITIGANSRKEMVRQGYRSEYFNFWDIDEIEELVWKAGLSLAGSFYRKMKIEDCIGIIARK